MNIRGLPVVVGVTGHRDILPGDEGPLKSAFGALLRKLKIAYPHSELAVLSGLAAGADILAAEEALAQGIPVIGCLPMDVVRYEQDFSPEETTRFRAVLPRCARVHVVADEEDRRRSYVAVGFYIAHYSHIVAAFWDGLEGKGAGGTADVVRMRLEGLVPEFEDPCGVPYLPDIGPVYRIATPHRSQPQLFDAYTIDERFPERFAGDRFATRDFDAALRRLDVYNADLAKESREPAATLQELMDRTDGAANRLQRHTLRYVQFLYVVGFVAAAMQIGTGNWSLKLGVLALAFVVYLLARRNDYENRYQDYRAIAEGLRVQLAWDSIGLNTERVEASYLRMQQSELQWIRIALRTAYLVYCEPNGTANAPSNEFRLWIEGQCDYYQKAARREEKARHAIATTSTTFVVLAILTSLYAFFILRPAGGTLALTLFGMHLQASWQFLVQVPLALAGALSLFLSRYAEKRSFGPNAKRYDRMFLVFDKARSRLSAIDKDGSANAQTLVRELGQEALIEHGEWLLARRDRPLSFVHN